MQGKVAESSARSRRRTTFPRCFAYDVCGGSRRLRAFGPFRHPVMPDGSGILRNAKHALHPAGHTARNPADCAANRATDRTGRAVTHGRSFLRATDNALRLGRQRRGQEGKTNSGDQNLRSHDVHSSENILGPIREGCREFPYSEDPQSAGPPARDHLAFTALRREPVAVA
jgi:hypothetical protein